MPDSAPTSSVTPPTAKRTLLPPRRLKALLTLAILAVVALSWLDVLDRATQRQVEGATTQALLAFAAARGSTRAFRYFSPPRWGLVCRPTPSRRWIPSTTW